ncbi:MAG: hypothetical protein U9N61_07350 [Euryarchaeota archaeon]|nr:hypothetical protein [Euryarchaeota archaeon]
MATTYNDVDNSRQIKEKAALYDQLVAESSQNEAERAGMLRGARFGSEQGYKAGMADNNATSEAAYAMGRRDGTGSGARLGRVGQSPEGPGQELVSDPNDGAGYPGFTPQSPQELEAYAQRVGQLVQTGEIGENQANQMVMAAKSNMDQLLAGANGGGFGQLDNNVTNRAADISMQ